jgi:uncharacterized protein (TIGR02996 family)
VSEREAFLRALAENENDTTARLVYADWLDEHGEYEEADLQRRWVAAREWLVKFCDDNNPPADWHDDAYVPFEKLMELARATIETDNGEDLWRACLNNDALCTAIRDNAETFWKHAALITGAVPLPYDYDDGSGCPGGGGC